MNLSKPWHRCHFGDSVVSTCLGLRDLMNINIVVTFWLIDWFKHSSKTKSLKPKGKNPSILHPYDTSNAHWTQIQSEKSEKINFKIPALHQNQLSWNFSFKQNRWHLIICCFAVFDIFNIFGFRSISNFTAEKSIYSNGFAHSAF